MPTRFRWMGSCFSRARARQTQMPACGQCSKGLATSGWQPKALLHHRPSSTPTCPTRHQLPTPSAISRSALRHARPTARYIHMHLHMHTLHVHAHAHAHAHVHAHVHVTCACACAHVCMCMCTCVHVHVHVMCMQRYIHTHMHMQHTHAHAHVHVHVRVHVHVHVTCHVHVLPLHCPSPSRGRHRCCLQGCIGRARRNRRTSTVRCAQRAVPLLGHRAAVLYPLAARAGRHTSLMLPMHVACACA